MFFFFFFFAPRFFFSPKVTLPPCTCLSPHVLDPACPPDFCFWRPQNQYLFFFPPFQPVPCRGTPFFPGIKAPFPPFQAKKSHSLFLRPFLLWFVAAVYFDPSHELFLFSDGVSYCNLKPFCLWRSFPFHLSPAVVSPSIGSTISAEPPNSFHGFPCYSFFPISILPWTFSPPPRVSRFSTLY